MLHAAADVAILLVGRGEVRYAMSQKEKRKGDIWREHYWYEATLDFEELKGTSGALIAGFVPIFLCRQWSRRPFGRISRLEEALRARQTVSERNTAQRSLNSVYTPLSLTYLPRRVDRLSYSYQYYIFLSLDFAVDIRSCNVARLWFSLSYPFVHFR